MSKTYIQTMQTIAAQFRQLAQRFEADTFDLIIESNQQLIEAYEARIRQLEDELTHRPLKVVR